MSSEAFVLQPGEGRPIDLGGFMMTVKATADANRRHAVHALGGQEPARLRAADAHPP